MELIDKTTAQLLSEANLQYLTLSVVFLPDELSEAQKIIDDVKNSVKTADATWLTKRSQYDDWLDAQENVQSAYGIKNVATALDIILKMFKKNITQLQSGYDKSDSNKKWVSLETVIGRNKIPAESAKKISKAVRKIQGNENLKESELWKTLEILAENYLAGD